MSELEVCETGNRDSIKTLMDELAKAKVHARQLESENTVLRASMNLTDGQIKMLMNGLVQLGKDYDGKA